MDKEQLKNLIIRTLKSIDQYSPDAVNLLLGTAAQESHLGHYIRQLSGPALGIFQMEPATFMDIINNYLKGKSLKDKIKEVCNVSELSPVSLEYNLKLAICMTRVHYLRKPSALPSTIEGYAAYWKKWYNTPLGAGKESEFITNYNRYILS